MKQVEERYISLLTDFGFKRIFGTAMNKDLLICFLNSLFNGRHALQLLYHMSFTTLHRQLILLQNIYAETQNFLVLILLQLSLFSNKRPVAQAAGRFL